MRRPVRALTFALALGLIAVSAFGLPATAEAATVTVDIFGVNGDDGGGNPNPVCTGAATCAYNPNPTNISTGDSINFVNVGALNHTATGPTNFGPPLNQVVQPGGGSCPAGSNGNCFSTGSKSPGQSQLIGPFPNTSSFDYYCEVHGPGVMIATLNVAGGGGTTTTTTTTTTTAPTTTTTTGATTTTTAPTTTTTTGATTTTTAGTTTTTTAPTTTTTAGGCTTHDLVVQLPASQPPMKIGSIVNVSVIVTNAGNCTEVAHVTLSGTINYSSAQNATLAPGSSQTIMFQYPVPLRLEVTLTASAPLNGDVTPANNSDTKTYPTVIL